MVGKTVIVIGAAVVVLGVLLWLIEAVGGRTPGALPGDIHVRRGNFSFYFPLATCVALSVLVTLILSILARRR